MDGRPAPPEGYPLMREEEPSHGLVVVEVAEVGVDAEARVGTGIGLAAVP